MDRDIDQSHKSRSRSRFTPEVVNRKHKRRRDSETREDCQIKKKHRRRHRSTTSDSSDQDEGSRPRVRSDSRRRRSRKRSREEERRSRRSLTKKRSEMRRTEHRKQPSDRSRSSSTAVSDEQGGNIQVNKSMFANRETQLFLNELIKSLTTAKSEGNKFPMLGNVIPEFDPMVKGQTVHMWLNKVDECAKLYRWGDDQVIHYALPRLTGVARTWYHALPSMSFSWPEWKIKLIESFPSSDDYAELLTEMLNKRVKYNEPLELYYYEKLNLLNRCEIFGKRAVDCLLYGIEDRSLRLGAKAAKCQEPEGVLNYFQSIKQSRDFDKSKISQDKKTLPSSNTNSTNKQSGGYDSRLSKPQSSASVTCFNCNQVGHFSNKCTQKLLRCNVCKRLGHVSIDCPQLSNEKSKDAFSTEKKVMKIDVDDTSNEKYFISLKVNGIKVKGYVDLGSQCTLMQCSVAKSLGVRWSVDELPIMRGLGNNIVVPIGMARVKIDISNIAEMVDVYVVEDCIIKYPVLIGHSFTEKPGIIITKTTNSLVFSKEEINKLQLFLKADVAIQPKQMAVIPVISNRCYSGSVYVRGSLRGPPGKEFYLLPGEYYLENSSGALLVQNFSDRLLLLNKDTLVSRVYRSEKGFEVKMLDFNHHDTISDLNYGSHLSNDEVFRLKSLLKKYEGCFSSCLADLGFTNVVQMEIELNDAKPVVYRPYRLSYPERELVREMVQEMIDADIVCESNSPYASPILLVRKKTGEKS